MKTIFILVSLITYFSIQLYHNLHSKTLRIYMTSIPDKTQYSVDLKNISKKIKIAIIDTEVNYNDKLIKPFIRNPENINKNTIHSNHATAVTSILIFHLNQVFGTQASELFEIKVFSVDFKDSEKKSISDENYFDVLGQAILWNPDVINISITSDYSYGEDILINLALRNNIKVFSAAGNFGDDSKRYPCSLKGVICVGANNKVSNFGDQVSLIVDQQTFMFRSKSGKVTYDKGTSFASPIAVAQYVSLKINSKTQNYFKDLVKINNKNIINYRRTVVAQGN